jgi:hypothetical protein
VPAAIPLGRPTWAGGSAAGSYVPPSPVPSYVPPDSPYARPPSYVPSIALASARSARSPSPAPLAVVAASARSTPRSARGRGGGLPVPRTWSGTSMPTLVTAVAAPTTTLYGGTTAAHPTVVASPMMPSAASPSVPVPPMAAVSSCPIGWFTHSAALSHRWNPEADLVAAAAAPN